MTRKSRTSVSASLPTSTSLPSGYSCSPSPPSLSSDSPSSSSSDPESNNTDPLDPELTPHIPRPPNSFMLFRAEWFKKYKDTHKDKRVVQRVHSKSAGADWAVAPPEVKQHYAHLAEQAARAHKERYPGYKYRPGPQKYKNGVRIVPPKPRGRRKKVAAEPQAKSAKRATVSPISVTTSTEASSEPECVSFCSFGALYTGDRGADETRTGLEASWLEEPCTTLGCGADYDVVPDGDLAVEEMERLYIQFDMPPHDLLRDTTSGNSTGFHTT
ncbi:hypothetical protein C8Q80DRAFT_133603 [Daedaleopsis nitida]|nr:hypothetical protein C8Q80DRAFT_133603 [Daedaleopsis nitida]